MPYVRRTDGFDAAHAAHSGNALGGLNEIVRDRSVAPDQPTEIVFWTTTDDIQPGDEVCGGVNAEPTQNAEAYDVLAGPVLQASYEWKFIPDKEQAVARCDAAIAQSNAAVDAAIRAVGIADPDSPEGDALRIVFMEGTRQKHQDVLRERRDQIQVVLDNDNGELTSIKADLAAGRSVRVERLRRPTRPGRVITKAADRLLGESFCDERDRRA